MMVETKTPVVKKHWAIIGDIKNVLPKSKVVLVGDHVTALPQSQWNKARWILFLLAATMTFYC